MPTATAGSSVCNNTPKVTEQGSESWFGKSQCRPETLPCFWQTKVNFPGGATWNNSLFVSDQVRVDAEENANETCFGAELELLGRCSWAGTDATKFLLRCHPNPLCPHTEITGRGIFFFRSEGKKSMAVYSDTHPRTPDFASAPVHLHTPFHPKASSQVPAQEENHHSIYFSIVLHGAHRLAQSHLL